MRLRVGRWVGLLVIAALPALSSLVSADETPLIPSAKERFDPNADAVEAAVKETPDFQRHVLPAMGRLGCNGRACHGSFQGQGGFRLSLFGYDFKADHEALMAKETGRVNLGEPGDSKILSKPTMLTPHKGGKRMEADSWEYELLTRWVEDGAKLSDEQVKFERLEVIPREIVMTKAGETTRLQVIAHWADGAREDVTCLSRFRTNDESIAEVDENGRVTGRSFGDTHVVAFYDNGVAPVAVIRPVSELTGDKYPRIAAKTKVDEHVLTKLGKLGIVPAATCSDSEFLRRVSLDMTGALPTPEEVEAFAKASAPDKRARKIDELLARPAYSAYWTAKISDYVGNSQRSFQNQQYVGDMSRQWYEWIEKRVRENQPYDKIVEGMVMAVGRSSDQSYEDYVKQETAYAQPGDDVHYADRSTAQMYWARRTVRNPDDKALNFSYAFLGIRLECAQCHKHPFDQWTQNDFKQFSDFFKTFRYGQTRDFAILQKELQEKHKITGKNNNDLRRQIAQLVSKGESVPFEEMIVEKPAPPPANPKAQNNKNNKRPNANNNRRVFSAKPLGDDEIKLADYGDPRQPLMDWLRSSDNPYFAKAFVNRVWANYFSVGIVNPPDDQNLANPPSNEALLNHLVKGFVEHGYDMKWLHREIANSETYQRSWATNETNRLDERNFSRAVVRRLPAEVVLDAIDQATAKSEAVAMTFATSAEAIETRFIGPKNASTQVRDGYAGNVFGQTKRDTNCDCSRSNDPNLLQAIFMANDERDLLSKVERPDGWIAELFGRAKQSADRERIADREKRIADGKAMKTELGKELDQIESQIKDLTDKLAKARQAKDQDRARKLQARLVKVRQNLAVARKALAAPVPADRPQTDPNAGLKLANPEEVVREAYRRTLSRTPNESELRASLDYLKDGDARKGLRDLLWALLNTKEFITNH